MALQSANTILKSTQFWAFEEKTQRYIKHQFQDYAYRLALKLGDLSHKPIYMRLAKTVPHALLEQAASFADDYRDEPNKGKLFMWKLKQLREEYDYKQAAKNFAQAHVVKTMATFFDQFAQELIQKHQQQFNDSYEAELRAVAEYITQDRKARAKPRVLVLQSGALDLNYFVNLGFKTTAYDISRTIVSKAKEKYPKLGLKHKQDFTALKSPTKYQALWGYRLWNIVSLDTEVLHLSILNRMCEVGAVMALCLTCGDAAEEQHSWQELEHNSQKYLYYQKINNLDKFREKAEATGWSLTKISSQPQGTLVWLQKMTDVLPIEEESLRED